MQGSKGWFHTCTATQFQFVLLTEESRCPSGPSVTMRCLARGRPPTHVHAPRPGAYSAESFIRTVQETPQDKVQRCTNDNSMFAEQKRTVSSEWIGNGRTKGRHFQALHGSLLGVLRTHKSPGETAGFVADAACAALLGSCWFRPARQENSLLICCPRQCCHVRAKRL